MTQRLAGVIQHYSVQARMFFLVVAGMGFAIDGVYTVLLNLYLLRLDYGTEFIGLVNAVGLLTFALTSLPAGVIGTRWSNTRMMKIGVGIVVVSGFLLPMVEYIPVGIAQAWIVATYAMLLAGFSVFFVNAAPFLMDSVQTDQRHQAFALKTALLSLAAFFGSLAGGFIPELIVATQDVTAADPAPYRITLMLVTIVLLGAFGFVMTLKQPESEAEYFSEEIEAASTSNAPMWSLSAVAVIGMMTLVRLLQVAGSATVVVYFNVYMDTELHISIGIIGLIAAVGRFAGVIAALSVPRLVRRFGNNAVIIGGALATAACMLPLAFFENGFAAAIGFMGVLATTAIRYSAFLVYILELVPKVQQSVMSGSGEMAAGFSFAAMALGGGFILSLFTFRDLFLLGAAMTVLGTFIFWGHAQNTQRRKRKYSLV